MHEDVTCIITTSPIESHPSTAIIAETIRSIQHHFPHSKIIVACDGVRPEQEEKRADYYEYINRIPKGNHIHLIQADGFIHQALLMMDALEFVTTPFVLALEHDTPLLERWVDWDMLKGCLLSGETNHIRLHYDEEIHPEHEHLMLGKLTPNLVKTVQFHNRPSLTKTDWFLQALHNIFSRDSRSFIEDRVYSFVQSAPWEQYRCTIYDPDGSGKLMKRSGHTNGRGAEPKYEMKF